MSSNFDMPERWRRVIELRRTHTQTETARIMGVSQARIYQIEKSIARKKELMSLKPRKNIND